MPRMRRASLTGVPRFVGGIAEAGRLSTDLEFLAAVVRHSPATVPGNQGAAGAPVRWGGSSHGDRHRKRLDLMARPDLASTHILRFTRPAKHAYLG